MSSNHLIRARLVLIATLGFALSLSSLPARAVTITQLDSESAFLSTSVFSTDFETSVNSDLWIFDSSASVTAASSAVRGMTPSGMKGLTEPRGREPLTAFLLVDAYEVGMYFGNDDFGSIFDAELTVFDALGTLLGSVVVESNGNDYADQFIGLRSLSPFRFVTLSYERPAAGGLSLYVDDFYLGITPPPLPGTGTDGGIPGGVGGGASIELAEPHSALLLGLATLVLVGPGARRAQRSTTPARRLAADLHPA
ncbi:MAG: hypothetical protein R3286_00980 [Gammaproteobacteria bacterium]|nr:hypothetical protein [Gammaproteobacteria bacterium]